MSTDGIAMLALALGCINGIANLIMIANAIRRAPPDDPYVTQAVEDQKRAAYPHCRDGVLNCGDMICGCIPDSVVDRKRFVLARAEALRKRDQESHYAS